MKAIVVEDSRLAREGLLRMLNKYSSLEVVGDAEHAASALELIKEYQPDVLFLDIHMPGETGFDLLDKLDYTPHIIFTTAFSEYAYRSFDYNAVDYLLKPISQSRLTNAIDRLAGLEAHAQSPAEKLEPNSKIFIKDGDNCHLVTLSSIRYFESCKNYVRVFFASENSEASTSAFIKKALSAVEERLPSRQFFRISRQYVVNLFEISAIDEAVAHGYDITMSDGKRLSVSRRNAAELKNRLSF